MSHLKLYLTFITFITHVNSDSSCVDFKASKKLKQFHSSRKNFLIVTNTSCSINYFDLSTVNRFTLSVIGKSEILKNLDLSHNAISNIESGTFDEFVALENLNVRNNFLRTLGDIELQTLSALTILDLSSNLLEYVDIKAFAKLKNLLWLSLSDNCLINVLLVMPFISLHSLDLSHNRINGLPQLVGISSITALDISYNRISDLTQIEIVRNLVKSISSLNMAGNQLRHTNQLQSFVNLVELNLAENPIDYSVSENFIRQSVAALKKLNLTNTNLTTLNIFRHVNCENFEELSFAHNSIDVTDFDELLKFSNIKHLQFQQKFCREFDSYRAIRRNFKSLKFVTILYDDTPSCACVRRNEMLFKFESIDFTTDWSVCSSASTAAAVREYVHMQWSNVGVALAIFYFIYVLQQQIE
ncbi:hypothetical protein PVAND_000300 [Polypedilum vanderplanki]|uniref:Uncharacterized protein n=1 Tax=Polypedilum vanderplanki TaxID=319348 RepID=A0A9J6BJN6_POLVA|nr:hypothetical protein PVAND_000300 [Polypedilum vanderplanki]